MLLCSFFNGYGQSTWINEIHYDNTGTDSDEGFEIAGPAGTDLTGWSVSLYNGSNTSVYDTVNLSGIIPNEGQGYGAIWFGLLLDGLQNGSPDGLALVAEDGVTVIQFLSYEGTITATNGPATNMTSSDIGVSESNSTLEGNSLQLRGSGCQYSDFTWAVNSLNSRDTINSMQFTTCYFTTYNGNGNTDGSAPEDTTAYNSGSPVTILGQSTLVKPCYVFSGWNTDADGSGIAFTEGNTFTISSPTTLYAQWVFDSNCDMIMISQYYEGTSSNKWIEIKNRSGITIPANSFYLAVYNKGTAEQPLNGVPSNAILVPSMSNGEVIRFKESLTSEPNYTNTDGITSEIMFANSFSGDDILVISTTNDASCYDNRVNIMNGAI